MSGKNELAILQYHKQTNYANYLGVHMNTYSQQTKQHRKEVIQDGKRRRRNKWNESIIKWL